MAAGSNNVNITVTVANNSATGLTAVNNGLQGLQNQVNNTNNAVTNFTRDSQGRLRDASGRFVTAGSQMSGVLGDVASQAGETAKSLGSSGGAGGGGLGGVLGGLTGIIGMSALPAIGALAPMLLGAGAAGGVVALAMGDIKKEAKTLKPELEGLQKAASKAIMPGVKSMFKDFKVVMKDLSPVVDTVGQSVGGLAAKAGKFVNSPMFKQSFTKNVELGTKWFNEFGDSILKFTGSFLEFGAKSERTLDALGGGINDVLGIGLPGMFKGLEDGIGGSAEMFDGLFDALNLVLPALGRLSGQVAETFGPVLGSAFRLIGEVASAIMDGLRPALEELVPTGDAAAGALDQMSGFLTPLAELLGKVLAQAIRIVAPLFQNLFTIFSVIAPLAKELAVAIGGALFSSLNEVFGLSDKAEGFNGKLKDFGNWAATHKGEITEGFRQISNAIMDMVIFGIEKLPGLLEMFKIVTTGILDGFDVIVSGAAHAFGWIPGIGEKFKNANEDFDNFRSSYETGLETAIEKANEFKDKAVPKLSRNQLKLNIANFERQIGIAKKELKDPNLTKERRAKINADIRELTRKKNEAQNQLNNIKDKTPKIKGDKRDFDSKASAVSRKSFKDKIARIFGDSGGFWGTVRGIAGKVVGSAIINLVPGGSLLNKIGGMFAHGGIVGQAASGGARSRMTLVGERGPELVDLAPGSRVRSNDDTRRLMGSGQGSSGGGGAPMVIQLRIGDRQLGEVLVDPIRKIVSAKGGNVQAVLGR